MVSFYFLCNRSKVLLFNCQVTEYEIVHTYWLWDWWHYICMVDEVISADIPYLPMVKLIVLVWILQAIDNLIGQKPTATVCKVNLTLTWEVTWVLTPSSFILTSGTTYCPYWSIRHCARRWNASIAKSDHQRWRLPSQSNRRPLSSNPWVISCPMTQKCLSVDF